jgi:alpha-D-xyloside xylohydrolase
LNTTGKQFLVEEPGSRRLTPEILPGATPTPAYRAQLGFRIGQGEAVYGLGQHQDGFLDYRGTSVVLEQVNREIAIPFLVTSGGYGLLWNNPSHTVVNVASKSSDLPPTNEIDETGKPGAFTARYYRGEHFDNLVATTREEKIDHNWDKTPPDGLPREHYSARWTGSILAPKSGTYTFKTESDDGVRLWIDDRAVIDNWSVHAPTVDTAKLVLKGGTRHRLRLEYFQAGGGAVMRLNCGIEQPTDSLNWDSEAADGIDYCVFYGPSIDSVIAEYRQETGEAPLPPKTALGYWQSKERYSTQKEWIAIASEYRRRRHPIDNLVQDWFYWDPWPWGSHRFDPKRYPDPAAGIASLHNDYHLQFMISVWGKFIEGTPDYPNSNLDAMDAKGYLYPGIDSNERYYDAFNPNARTMYWGLMRDQLFKFGVDAWWLDASEPEVNMRDFRPVQTAAGPGALVLNAWPLMHTVGVSQGQLASSPNKRVFILTRSAYAGQQRTGAACWSGDISATWQVYANQIPAGLNFCLSGIPYWTTDIGAFFVPGGLYPQHASDPAYRELFTRWFQYGSFCPIFRVHGTDFAKEMWRFGPSTEKILNQYDELRYRLMPYIYSQAWGVTAHGGTLMRALAMDFPQDKIAREAKDEFMFGPSLLICPVIKPGVQSREVYLPSGANWIDFWTGKSYAGGLSLSAAAPIDKLPIFVRAGAIVPTGPLMQYVDEKPTDPLTVRIYPGANGSFDLYEDEGMNNNYRRGTHAIIPMAWDDRQQTLTIGTRTGSFPGMLKMRTIEAVVVKSGTGGVQAAKSVAVTYRGAKTVIRLRTP